MSDVATLVNEGNELAKKKQWAEALEHYRAAAALAPADPEIWFLMGCCHFKMNHGPGAREAWEKALNMDPTYEKARIWIHQVTGLTGQVPITAKI
ncbi:MAG: tetratricopeptide repeat protein [Candidatus Omnitrophica bacterium]|nr:tetratricopeptide repeat protein [Candidatus Omnitrophota bacterium]MCA9423937.1 tetratricopeptide repeat protein [Candidatus Omnitrophota bacterium]MCA9438982.1 tetratricopeptide repeat protein [Candidatus Omnitrophota bacterium]MCA9447331.1 tetratricopeptide repeat protein [Candidatus Omnitrophota bacterium]